MFIVESFDGSDWNEMSRHTQRVDAEKQVNIFHEDNGTDLENMRIREEN